MGRESNSQKEKEEIARATANIMLCLILMGVMIGFLAGYGTYAVMTIRGVTSHYGK